MKTLVLECRCGGLCHTTLKLDEDSENKKNIYLAIKNEKYDLASFVSLDRESALEIVKFIKSKYKGIE
jgi:hypothetical protein